MQACSPPTRPVSLPSHAWDIHARGAHADPNSLHSDDYEAKCAFSDFANWIIPGSVLLGRYPFIEPSRCLTRAQGEMHLSQILEADIDTFVCLQVRRQGARARPAPLVHPQEYIGPTLLPSAAAVSSAWTHDVLSLHSASHAAASQEELPAQEQLKMVGKSGFMPYKTTAELIQCSLNK